MTWNKLLPGNNEKIRSLGTAIRPNWEAIEEGDDVGVANMLQMRSVQLDNRTGLAANVDPQTNVGTQYLYSKDDGGGVQEGFMKDSAANIIQLTNDGGLGAADMRLNFQDFTNDDGTTVYDERNFCAYWGFVSAAGVLTDSSGGMTVVKGSKSNYTITFTVPQLSVNYCVLLTGVAGGNARIAMYDNKIAASFDVKIVNESNALITAGAEFCFSVFGGRPT